MELGKTYCRECRGELQQMLVSGPSAFPLSGIPSTVTLLYCNDPACKMAFVLVNGGLRPKEHVPESVPVAENVGGIQ